MRTPELKAKASPAPSLFRPMQLKAASAETQPVNMIHLLQRTIGNRATQKALQTQPADLHQLARGGTSGAGSPLPYLDRIQRSFGPGHDLGGVTAHSGSEAAEASQKMGAEAYATGERVAFGGSPSLHIAAHEAAHVVQQRSGVALPDGIGQVGDDYERNADAVAERVVRGESAADLLPAPPGAGEASSASAASAGVAGGIQRYTKVPAGKPYDVLSDDGKMAVKDHSREAWAESTNIAQSNKVLDVIKSKAKIKELSGSDITVKAPGGTTSTTLKKFQMVDRVSGAEVELEDDCGSANQQMLGAGAAGYESFVGVTKKDKGEEFTGASKYEADDNAAGGIVSTTERMSGEIYVRIFAREYKKTLSRVDALKEWDKLSAADKKRLEEKYGINKYAVPKVGQGVTIGSERDMPGATSGGYNFHFGLNLIASGQDYITLEDYDSSGVKYYFDMYGPQAKGQSWAEDPSNTGALGNKTTTMVVQHPESLNGIINVDNAYLEDDPNAPNAKKPIAKNDKVTLVQKGTFWSKVEVKSGAQNGKTGWIQTKFFTDN